MNFRICIEEAMYEDINTDTIKLGEDILSFFNLNRIEPEQVYETTKQTSDLGDIHLGNIHLQLIVASINTQLHSENLDFHVDAYINCLDSHLSCKGYTLTSLDQFKDFYKKATLEKNYE